MSFDEFAKEYTELLERLLSYKPGTIGAIEFSEKLGELVDSVPEDWENKVQESYRIYS